VAKGPARFFAPGPFAAGETVVLKGEERRHARARRLRRGDRVTLIDGTGSCAEGRIAALDADCLEVVTERLIPAQGEAPAPITLYVSAVKMPRLSWLFEKATELGAARIVVAGSSRAQAERLRLASREKERLSRLSREAAKQCGRTAFPRCEEPEDFETVLADASRIRLLLDPSGDPFPASLSAAPAALWLGPEGGFTEPEVLRARAAEWRITRLPAATLRTETAALTALALLRASFDTGGGGAQNTAIGES
jgi:16S rRNA (uracil1498-N3)-methyltransferase